MFLYILIGVIAIALGFAIGYLIRQTVAKRQVNTAEERAEKMINDAKVKQQELMLRAKEKAIKIIDDAKREEEDRRRDVASLQKRLENMAQN